jgi:hypothetical protein
MQPQIANLAAQPPRSSPSPVSRWEINTRGCSVDPLLVVTRAALRKLFTTADILLEGRSDSSDGTAHLNDEIYLTGNVEGGADAADILNELAYATKDQDNAKYHVRCFIPKTKWHKVISL